MRHKLFFFILLCSSQLLLTNALANEHIYKPGINNTAETLFMRQNQSAMDEMMARMDVKPSGKVDEDFVAMMTPHHLGAIDMAMAELRYGINPQLKRLAQEIIVTQQQEITAMYQALGKPLPPSQAAPDQIAPAP